MGRALFSIVEIMLRTPISKAGTALRRWYKRGFWWAKAAVTGWFISLYWFMGGRKDLVHSFKMSFKYAENHYSSPQAMQVATLVFYTTQLGLGGGRNKDFLFKAPPSTVSQSLHSSRVAHMCVDGKGSINRESSLHVVRGFLCAGPEGRCRRSVYSGSTVVEAQEVTCLAPELHPALEDPPGGTQFIELLGWGPALGKKRFTETFIPTAVFLMGLSLSVSGE